MRRPLAFISIFCVTVMLSSIAGERRVAAKADTGMVKRSAVGVGVGYRPPEFSASDLNGQRQDLQQYQGNVLVLHFWASWCPYCRGEIPKLLKVHGELASKGVKVLTVSTDQDVAKLKQFVAENHLPYPVIADLEADPSVADQYGVSGIPVTLIVTKDGHIAYRLTGTSDIVDSVQHVLEQLS